TGGHAIHGHAARWAVGGAVSARNRTGRGGKTASGGAADWQGEGSARGRGLCRAGAGRAAAYGGGACGPAGGVGIFGGGDQSPICEAAGPRAASGLRGKSNCLCYI